MIDRLPDIPGYDVDAELGRGGMGVVYRARRRSDGEILAIKMLLQSRGASYAELARFRIEAEALACLNHPNIINIRDFGLYCGYPFFATDLAVRGSLKQVASGKPQESRRAAELVRIIATAMQHAHDRGMLHRDLKLANVLVMEDGTLKVSDFGLVKFAHPILKVREEYATFGVAPLDAELVRFAEELEATYDPIEDADHLDRDEIVRRTWDQCATRTQVLGDETRLDSIVAFLGEAQSQPWGEEFVVDGLTRTGSVMGSPNYMAPEQARGELEKIGPRTDVFALGGILYELLTGRPPFRWTNPMMIFISSANHFASATPIQQLCPEVSDQIVAVCMRCLEESPDRRYQNAAELADDLSRFLDGDITHAQLPPEGDRPAAAEASLVELLTIRQERQTARDTPTLTRTWWPFGRRGSRSGRKSS